ncbi:hypothetical protein FH972_001151 [Carpinus fangiana]|uniref:Uncharacterized protein n=1 Tax=Carpinus fangiana TaxID=176857 RepID=A0A5N6QDI8_9ROSI|nr:hypothetical protein FH972_001151 [Carpinus fangiana]
MVEPYYDNKDVAKLAAQEAALAAPKLLARPTSTNTDITTTSNAMGNLSLSLSLSLCKLSSFWSPMIRLMTTRESPSVMMFFILKFVAFLMARSRRAALASPMLGGTGVKDPGGPRNTCAVSRDVEMADGNQSMHSLKPAGGIGKKFKRKFKMGKGKRRDAGCDKNTGNVVKLDLRNPFMTFNYYDVDDPYILLSNEEMKAYNKSRLGGKISSSLLDLKYFSYFDLSLNNFDGINIPKFLGSLESLTYLNLSFSLFVGVVTPHLWNLLRLQYLVINSFSVFTDSFNFSSQKLEVGSQKWVANTCPVVAIISNPRRKMTRWICKVVFKAKKCFPLRL